MLIAGVGFVMMLWLISHPDGSNDVEEASELPVQAAQIRPSITTTTIKGPTVTTTTAFDWESVEDAVQVVDEYVTMITPEPAPAPAPAPVAAAAPAPVVLAPAEFEALISEFFPGNEAWARRVMKCESGFNTGAVNPSSGTRGLFQIHPGWFDGRWGSLDAEINGLYVWDNMYEARANTHVASIIFHRNGGGPWSCK